MKKKKRQIKNDNDEDNKESESGSDNDDEVDNQDNVDEDKLSTGTVHDDSNKAGNTPVQAAASNFVKTADTTNIGYYIALLAVSFGLFITNKRIKVNKNK